MSRHAIYALDYIRKTKHESARIQTYIHGYIDLYIYMLLIVLEFQ